MEIEGANILITGAAGLIGSTTAAHLLRRASPGRIVLFDDLSRGTLANLKEVLGDRRVEFVWGDVRDMAAVRHAMRGIDAMVHMAALRITACAAEPHLAMEVMCGGSFNVVEAAREAGVRKVIAASSASIYGLAETFPTAENHHPYNDETLYGATKTLLEGLLRSYHAMHGLPYVVLRYFNVYGPRMDRHGRYTEVLVRWMERITEGEPPLILGDGLQTMDFVYVDDVARANVAALRSDVENGVFNVASGVETSLRELAAGLLEVMSSDLQPAFSPERSVNPVSRRLADVDRARRLLGFEAKVGLHEGLRRLVEWWEASREAEPLPT